MEKLKLSAVRPGETAVITALEADQNLYCRLAALGFREGKQVKVIRKARFSGPLHVRIGTTDVVLRPAEASQIDVQLAAA